MKQIRGLSILITLVTWLACGGTDGGVDAGVDGSPGFDSPVCPPCAADEICLVTCDGDSTPDAQATCVPNPLDCPTDPGLCSAECEEDLCGDDGPYSCTAGYYCPRAQEPAFYCQGS